ncbi:MAG: lysophospholipid acyltransferase family protein [Anaerolineae bacterium]|nr:1-acyl-sn-glycerol-3-phosphate acyltransferase [Anaerolineae bacterium]MDW8101044.1 lysophospholipid acyltransferase family protein [Anaerolineae bacterium]
MTQRSFRIPLGRRIWEPVLRFLLWLFTRVTVEGLENIPRTGPVILILNHVHFLDPVVLVAAMPRYAVPIAKAESLKWPVLGKLLQWYPVIPIRRGELDMAAMRCADRLLAEGQALIIAPEGTRSPTGGLQRGKEGFVFFARRHDPVIVPVAVTGASAFNANYKRFRRTSVHIRIGQPFKFRWPASGRVDKATMRRMADEAMYRIAAILPPEMRGVYSDLSQATADFLIPLVANDFEPRGRQGSQRAPDRFVA